MINSLNVSIDTNNTTNQYENYTNDYESYTEVTSDLSRGEIKYVYENLKNSDDKLEVEKENLKDIESVLDKVEYKEWKEVIPHLPTFHVNFKEDVFGLKELNIPTKYDLALIKQGDSALRYKDKVENDFSDSKYSFLKHLNKVNSLHFYHQRCELKLVNNVTTCIRFYQNNIHEKRDFSSKFSIHVIPEPRPFKYYNYFYFFYFFYFTR